MLEIMFFRGLRALFLLVSRLFVFLGFDDFLDKSASSSILGAVGLFQSLGRRVQAST